MLNVLIIYLLKRLHCQQEITEIAFRNVLHATLLNIPFSLYVICTIIRKIVLNIKNNYFFVFVFCNLLYFTIGTIIIH